MTSARLNPSASPSPIRRPQRPVSRKATLVIARTQSQYPERRIAWHLTRQVERLKLIVQNRRYLLMRPKDAEPGPVSRA